MNNAITMTQSVCGISKETRRQWRRFQGTGVIVQGGKNDPVSGWSRPPAIIDGGRGSPSSGGKVRGISVEADVKS